MLGFLLPFYMKQLDACLAESNRVAGRIDGPRATITVKLSTTTTPSYPPLTIIAIFSQPDAINDCSSHCFEPKSFRFTNSHDRRYKLSNDGAADDPDCPGLGSEPLNARSNQRQIAVPDANSFLVSSLSHLAVICLSSVFDLQGARYYCSTIYILNPARFRSRK